MYIQTEGIILKQVKAANSRRMISIFTKNYGKISCGTSMTEGGKNKTALALRPFTYGNYQLFKGRENYNIQGAETIKTYYNIGEDIDKYLAACYVLELSDRALLEDQPQPKLFMLLLDFMDMLSERKKAFQTLVIGYQTKLLDMQGLKPSEGLKSTVEIDIIDILSYIETHKLRELQDLALKPDTEDKIRQILKDYLAYHLGIEKLKSDGLII